MLKTVILSVGIILAVLFTLPIIIHGVLNTGNYMGLSISSFLILYGVFFNSINTFFTNAWKNLIFRIAFSSLAVLLSAMLLFAIVVAAKIFHRANVPPNVETTVVVLGCRVRETGPSTMLLSRLEAAYKYLSQNPDARCILSGGKGEDEPMAESEYMYNWLVDKGVAPERLYTESESTSTEENLLLSKKIIEEKGLAKSITIITNDFHQYRAYRFAKEAELESFSYSAKTPFLLYPTYFIREICGVAHMIFIGS